MQTLKSPRISYLPVPKIFNHNPDLPAINLPALSTVVRRVTRSFHANLHYSCQPPWTRSTPRIVSAKNQSGLDRSSGHSGAHHATLIFFSTQILYSQIRSKSCVIVSCRLFFNRPMVSFSILESAPSKNSTPPCASPTVGANCLGIVTTDVLSVRT